MHLNIESDISNAIAIFVKIENRIKNMRPALLDAGEEMIKSVSNNFDAEGRFSIVGSYIGGSNKWKKWSNTTKRIKEKQGRSNDKILQASGRLIDSITQQIPQVDDTSVAIVTNLSAIKASATAATSYAA